MFPYSYFTGQTKKGCTSYASVPKTHTHIENIKRNEKKRKILNGRLHIKHRVFLNKHIHIQMYIVLYA